MQLGLYGDDNKRKYSSSAVEEWQNGNYLGRLLNVKRASLSRD